jgi:hypothetical protein
MRAERKGNRRRDNCVLMTSFQISLALGPSDGSALHNARFVPYSMTSSFFNTFSFEIGKRRAREALTVQGGCKPATYFPTEWS